MKFVLLEQKYLEHLEGGRALDALHVLRNELTPLGHDTARVHRLSALMMCAEPAELHARADWPGAGELLGLEPTTVPIRIVFSASFDSKLVFCYFFQIPKSFVKEEVTHTQELT